MTHRVRPESDWLIAPVPALIDQGTFDGVQQLLATCVRRGGPRNDNLLSMLLRCGRCGSGMAYNRKHRTAAYIRCNRRFADLRNYTDGSRCTMPHLRVNEIEAEVWECVCRWLLEPSLVNEYLQSEAAPPARQPKTLAVEVATLEAQLAEKHREQQLIVRKQLKGLLTEQTADAMLAAVAEQIGHLELRLAERQTREAPQHRVAVPRNVAAASAEVAGRLARLNQRQRIHLLRQLVRAVTVNEDRSWTVTVF
jgi:site-specific DNA recombinase